MRTPPLPHQGDLQREPPLGVWRLLLAPRREGAPSRTASFRPVEPKTTHRQRGKRAAPPRFVSDAMYRSSPIGTSLAFEMVGSTLSAELATGSLSYSFVSFGFVADSCLVESQRDSSLGGCDIVHLNTLL
jgi:hypothetical protein